MDVLPVWMSVYYMCAALCLWKPEEYFGFPATRVIDGCETPCGHCELNPSPLQEQQGLLSTEPTFQSHTPYFKEDFLGTVQCNLLSC